VSRGPTKPIDYGPHVVETAVELYSYALERGVGGSQGRPHSKRTPPVPPRVILLPPIRDTTIRIPRHPAEVAPTTCIPPRNGVGGGSGIKLPGAAPPPPRRRGPQPRVRRQRGRQRRGRPPTPRLPPQAPPAGPLAPRQAQPLPLRRTPPPATPWEAGRRAACAAATTGRRGIYGAANGPPRVASASPMVAAAARATHLRRADASSGRRARCARPRVAAARGVAAEGAVPVVGVAAHNVGRRMPPRERRATRPRGPAVPPTGRRAETQEARKQKRWQQGTRRPSGCRRLCRCAWHCAPTRLTRVGPHDLIMRMIHAFASRTITGASTAPAPGDSWRTATADKHRPRRARRAHAPAVGPTDTEDCVDATAACRGPWISRLWPATYGRSLKNPALPTVSWTCFLIGLCGVVEADLELLATVQGRDFVEICSRRRCRLTRILCGLCGHRGPSAVAGWGWGGLGSGGLCFNGSGVAESGAHDHTQR